MQRFEAPPLAVYPASGGVDLLAPRQQRTAVSAAGAVAPDRAALLPALASGRVRAAHIGAAEPEAVVLVMQNGSLFGIPAAHLTFDAASSGEAAAALPAGDQCKAPGSMQTARQLAEHGDSSAVLPFHSEQRQRPGPRGDVAQCKPVGGEDVDGHCAATLRGVYRVRRSGVGTLLLLPPAANDSSPAKGPATPELASWLVLLTSLGLGAAVSVVVVAWALRGWGAAVATAQRDPAAVATATQADAVEAAAPSSKSRRRAGKRQPQQMSNRVRGLMQQVALEPQHATLAQPRAAASGASAAVNHGQQPAEWQGVGSLPSTPALAAGLTDPAIQTPEAKDGAILVGRMRVG